MKMTKWIIDKITRLLSVHKFYNRCSACEVRYDTRDQYSTDVYCESCWRGW